MVHRLIYAVFSLFCQYDGKWVLVIKNEPFSAISAMIGRGVNERAGFLMYRDNGDIHDYRTKTLFAQVNRRWLMTVRAGKTTEKLYPVFTGCWVFRRWSFCSDH